VILLLEPVRFGAKASACAAGPEGRGSCQSRGLGLVLLDEFLDCFPISTIVFVLATSYYLSHAHVLMSRIVLYVSHSRYWYMNRSDARVLNF
jgi:hypothetical protein